MKLITEKAVALVNALEDKNAKMTEALKENSKLSGQLEDALAELKVKLANIKDREEAVKPIENIVALKQEAIAMKEEARKTVAEADARQASLSSALVGREKLVEEGKVKNDADRVSLAAGKKALEAKEADYKERVLRGVQKDLDAAKKKA